MLMTIRHQNGMKAEAVVLAAGRDRMRVALDSKYDTIELHELDARWYTEEGAEIEIEALVVSAGVNVPLLRAAVYPRTIASGC
jgi:hypothetical protein